MWCYSWKEKMQLTTEQRIFIVKKYYETKSYVNVRRAFQERFSGRNPPANRSIQENMRKYEQEGTSLNINKGRIGRRRAVRTPEAINEVTDLLNNQAREISCRRNPTDLKKSTFHNIVKKDLQWHPYKVHIVQELLHNDYRRRLRFCRWFCHAARNIRFLAHMIIGDEAIFQMNGTVCTQNVRCYAPKGQAPHDWVYQKKNLRQKLHVWVGLCGNGQIIGPYFFNRNVNGQTYREMLQQFAFPAIRHIYQRYNGEEFDDLWWFQDGAPAHSALDTRRLLRQRFGNRIVALHHPQEWPARSPDLTPLDFFLWGYLKQKVFSTPPISLPVLRRRIVNEVNLLRQNPDMIRRSFRSMVKKCNQCIQKNG